ncbi:MAG: URC4/urg3 family protein [Burkholderiales bacterium]
MASVAGAQDLASATAILRTTNAVRERAHALLERARRGESGWFTIDNAKLADATRLTIERTHARYPSGAIPFHSRWRHFEAGGVDRLAELDRLLEGESLLRERTRAKVDLVVVSVLLDAGAGADWSYAEAASGQRFTRSEGLGVASFHAFTAGLFSSDPKRPLQADAAGLQALEVARLGQAFQVSHANPLVGLEGRAMLLRRLGAAMAEQPEVFGPNGRPGGLLDAVLARSAASPSPTEATTPSASAEAAVVESAVRALQSAPEVPAHDIFAAVMQSFSRIWPSANAIDNVAPDGSVCVGSGDPAFALGDCWRHSAVRGPGLTDGWMPFHKLSQWLTYSLLEPFAWAGAKVVGLDALTGLPEYRNGGLFIDTGVIRVKDPALLDHTWKVSDEFIVEWRALTVALLDELAVRMRGEMQQPNLPLASILEGGTWAAGRELARRLRDGSPPLKIESDGTVF